MLLPLAYCLFYLMGAGEQTRHASAAWGFYVWQRTLRLTMLPVRRIQPYTLTPLFTAELVLSRLQKFRGDSRPEISNRVRYVFTWLQTIIIAIIHYNITLYIIHYTSYIIIHRYYACDARPWSTSSHRVYQIQWRQSCFWNTWLLT